MTTASKHLAAFAPLQWATPFLMSPNWVGAERTRGPPPTDASDRFCISTMRSFDGIQLWVELYQKPEPGTGMIKKTISLFKFGIGLNGFVGICHGGAMMTLMDEALGYAMVVNEAQKFGDWLGSNPEWKRKFDEGRSAVEVLKGFMVTARLDMKFLKPVLCPGVVGIEVEVLQCTDTKMKLRGIMKDEDGIPLIQADGLWIRIGGVPKL